MELHMIIRSSEMVSKTGLQDEDYITSKEWESGKRTADELLAKLCTSMADNNDSNKLLFSKFTC